VKQFSPLSSLGIYVHVPFCKHKCIYCDFYSLSLYGKNLDTNALMDRYTAALIARFWEHEGVPADTLYFGGGTPSTLGNRIGELVRAAKQVFAWKEPGEITVEVNPGQALSTLLTSAAEAGVNRVSIGLQSVNKGELNFLSRRHTAEDVCATAHMARKAGIFNLSVDIMLGIPGQTAESLRNTLDFCNSLGIGHVSAYILKAEPGTLLFGQKENLPDDEQTAEFYLLACEVLETNGLCQYEISNFARPGFECAHNLKYWRCEAYLGFGPAAHSFLFNSGSDGGTRFYQTRSLTDFFAETGQQEDGPGGDFAEFAMLAFRLTEGLERERACARFQDGQKKFDAVYERARKLTGTGLLKMDEHRIAFTPQGFLVSNQLIGKLIL